MGVVVCEFWIEINGVKVVVDGEGAMIDGVAVMIDGVGVVIDGEGVMRLIGVLFVIAVIRTEGEGVIKFCTVVEC